MPFPGRRTPTRVAWAFEMRMSPEELLQSIERMVQRRHRQTRRPVVEILMDADIVALRCQQKVRRLSYIGRPNRYRAMQAQRFLQRQPGESLTYSLEVEFDRGGILYSRLNGPPLFNNVHTAYHPHSGTLGPIDSFARRVYAKRVGGLSLYSYKDKLNQEEIDMFYAWYEKAFRKRLKRPKARAVDMKEAPNAVLSEMPEDR